MANVAVTLSKWGNSIGLRVPKNVLEDAHLSEGDVVTIEVEAPGVIRLRSGEESLTLEDLVAQITPENRHQEVDWGRPQGNEVW